MNLAIVRGRGAVNLAPLRRRGRGERGAVNLAPLRRRGRGEKEMAIAMPIIPRIVRIVRSSA